MILKTLVVDDDPMMLDLMKAYLKKREEIDLMTASDPLQALEMIKNGKFHILILDIIMPGMDGITLLEEAKKVDPLTHVIMMTSDSTLGRVIESLGFGALDFVMKPFETPDDMLDVVDTSIQRWSRWNRVLKKTARKTLTEK